jgi:hypothetical protein
MIKNFEEQTQELTEAELSLIPYLVNGLKTKTKSNPIKAPQIVASMNVFLQSKNHDVKLTEPRLRKCVNHIRTQGILPLIATSKGYFVSHDRQDILDQIDSLLQRANSISNCVDGLKKYL